VRLKAILYYAAVAAAVAAGLVVTLRLWELRPEVPFGYEGDALFFTVLAKASGQDGPLHFRHLGMPFGVEIADWGAGMPLDLTALGTLVAAFGEPGTAINTWWLLSVVATGVFAAFALRALDLGAALALGLGYLYALSPYAFYRNVAHVSLVYHFVPLIALLAVRTAEGRPERLSRGARAAVLLGCAGQGLSYIYYSFFSCFLLGAAALLGWLRTRRLVTLRLAAAGVLLIVIGTAAGLLPSLLYWHEHGRNPDLQYKLVLESDLFGLKIRHLLVPIRDHPLAPWRALAAAAAAAGFQGDNENTMGRLGTVGSLGFLGLLAYAVGAAAGLARRERPRLAAPAALTLVSLLLAQVGGFGSLFSLLVSPDIRAYNRIVVFIAFFSVLAAGLGLERLEATAMGRAWPAAFRGGVLLLLLLAVFDQASTTGLRRRHDENARQFDVDRAFVARLESRLPKGAMVFQLPHTGVPVERTLSRMATYDHGRAYLHSRSLRWSWGAIVGRNGNWQAEIQKLSPRTLVRTLVLAGFSGVWIDRLGYQRPPVGRPRPATVPPNPEAALVRYAGEPPEASLDGRYVFVGLGSARHRLVSALGAEGFAREAEKALLSPLVPRYREGFGEEDGDGVRVWRTCGPRGRIVVMNPVNREREVLLTAQLLPGGAGPPQGLALRGEQAIEISSPQFTDVVTATAGGTAYRRTAFLPARRRLQLHFSCPDRPAESGPCFQLVDFRAVDLSPSPEITRPVEDTVGEEN
jgi:phosphoglycerol transferase